MKIEINSIDCISSDGNYTTIELIDGTCLHITRNKLITSMEVKVIDDEKYLIVKFI